MINLNNLDNFNNSKSVTCLWKMSANKSESESKSDKEGQLDEDKSDFESRIGAAKEISQNKERENQLREIYGRRSILAARKQKLFAKSWKKKHPKLGILRHFGNIIVT